MINWNRVDVSLPKDGEMVIVERAFHGFGVESYDSTANAWSEDEDIGCIDQAVCAWAYFPLPPSECMEGWTSVNDQLPIEFDYGCSRLCAVSLDNGDIYINQTYKHSRKSWRVEERGERIVEFWQLLYN